MKKQEYISKQYDKNGNVINFERWGFKRVNTCIDHHLELLRSFGGLYDLDKTEKIVFYATPDGVNEECIAGELSREDIAKAIGA